MEIKVGERFMDYVGCKFWVSHITDQGLVLVWEDGIMEIWDKKVFIENLSANRFFRDKTKRWSDVFQSFTNESQESLTAEDFYKWVSKKYKVPESI